MEQQKKKKPIWLIILLSVVGLLVVIALAVVFFITGIFSNMHRDKVDIVSGPNGDISGIALPTADPFAEALETGVDYYETGEIQKVPIYEQSKIDRFITSVLVVVKNGSTQDDTHQTDMIFIVSWNSLQQKFTAVAIPRDILVPLEGYGWKRINAAYSYGDRGMLINTVNACFGTDIQDYVLIGTDELAQLADGIKGIPVDLTEAEAAYLNEQLGCSLKAGSQRITGEQAIQYLLDRTSDNKGAIGRAKCQLKVIKDTFNYMTDTFDKDFLYPFMRMISKGILTNMDFESLSGIGYEMCMSDDLSFVTICMPFEDSYTEMTYDGGYALLPEFEKNKILLQQALYGKEE
ncbi:MAG: LCP family protein [Clostridia bacterium]|nr:LCP family protein [Clostridia bacterium]